MSTIRSQGKVGSFELSWNPVPVGIQGDSEITVMQDGKVIRKTLVHWIKDEQRILIQTDNGYFDYEVRRDSAEDGRIQYSLMGRNHSEFLTGLQFLRHGEENAGGTEGVSKKASRVRAQMPGKIVRVMVKPGDQVVAGQALLVMEAMKMENEIKASINAEIKEVKVVAGQAVESGADLVLLKV